MEAAKLHFVFGGYVQSLRGCRLMDCELLLDDYDEVLLGYVQRSDGFSLPCLVHASLLLRGHLCVLLLLLVLHLSSTSLG